MHLGSPQVSVPDQAHLRIAIAGERTALERFIARRYRQVHGARIRHFMPELFGLYDTHNALTAAFGLRHAASAPLFLETYLDAPVEAVIAQQTARPIDREQVVEIGNLAGASPGALRLLIPRLCAQLQHGGCRWAVFTGSARLCNGFARLGLPLQVLTAADIDRLPPSARSDWGRYYDESPSVMVGDVASSFSRLCGLDERSVVLRRMLRPIADIGAP